MIIRRFGRPGAAVAMAATVVLVGSGTATADPTGSKNSSEVPLVCENGTTYAAVINGIGTWLPAHDLASNTMLIPTAFGEFHGVVTDEAGNVVDEFTDPAIVKGNATKPRKTSISCIYSFDETFTDPELGVLTFHGEGGVTGFATPAR